MWHYLVPSIFAPFSSLVKTAVYLLNRAPTCSVDGMTPYEAWHGKKPSVHHLRTFGCVAHVKRVGPGIDKLADISTPMIFVGYEEGSKAYRVYDPATKKVRISRDVKFEEQRKWDWTAAASDSTPNTDEPLVVVFPEEHTEDISTGVAQDMSPVSFATPAHSPGTVSSSSSGSASTTTPAYATRTVISPVQTTPSHGVEDDWASPPSNDHERHDLQHTPPHYRKMAHIFADLDKQQDEQDGMCLLAAEEPASVEEALAEPSWK
jgi:hypothetical protein